MCSVVRLFPAREQPTTECTEYTDHRHPQGWMKGQGLRLAQRHREARRRRDKPAFSQRKHPRNCEIYRTFLYHSIVLGLGRARGQRGELLPSSLHRGDTENPLNFPVFSVFSVCSVVGHIPESEWRTTEYTDYTECTSQEKLDTETGILDKV